MEPLGKRYDVRMSVIERLTVDVDGTVETLRGVNGWPHGLIYPVSQLLSG